MSFGIFLALITLLRLFFSQYFPVIGDEGVYWLWSQKLALSYVDHPPLIAYYLRFLTIIFGHTLLAFRVGAILAVTVSSFLIYQIGAGLFNRRTGYLSGVIFTLLPLYFGGGFFLVPQQLFALFWLLSMYFFVKIVKTQQGHWWFLLGLSVGLGLLSDYIMVLFFPAVGLYLLLREELRPWWKRPEPYLAAIISLIVFSPVLIWNIRTNFVPLAYWGGRSDFAVNYLQNFLNFAGLQSVLYTPVIFMAVFFLLQRIARSNKEEQLLASFSLPIFSVFALLSLVMSIGGHWPAAAYLPVIVWLAHLNNKKLTNSTIILALIVNISAIGYFAFFYPTPTELVGREKIVNQQLADYLRETRPISGSTYYYTNNMGVAGLVKFYGQVETYVAKGKLAQFDIWGQPKLKSGDNVTYFIWKDDSLPKRLRLLFRTVELDPQSRLFAKDSDIAQETKVYHCFGYLGGELP